MTAPHAAVGRQPRGRTKVRSKMWVDWRAWERSVTARTDQTFSLDRDSVGTARTDSILYTAVHSQPRYARVTANDGETYTVALLEGGTTNLVTQSEDLTHGDWSDVGTPTEGTPDAESGVSLDLIGDDDGSGLEGKTQVVSFTGNAVKAVSLFIKEGSSSSTAIRLRDTSAGADRLLAVVTWSSGVPSVAMTTGTEAADPELLTDGVYRLRLQTTSVTAANTNQVEIYPATDAALATSDTGNVYVGGVQAEDSAVVSSYIATTTAATARDDELFQTSDVGFTPQDIVAAGGLTVLTEWVELGTAFTGLGNSRYWHIGGSGVGDDPRMYLSDNGSGQVAAVMDDGTGLKTSTISGVSLFDRVQNLTTIFLDSGTWKIKTGVALNGNALSEDATPGSIGSTLPDAWSANTLTLGAAPDDTLHGFSGMTRLAMAPGVRSLSYMTV